ncbi:MAG: tetratricopeptide repeat protein [Treponema sp.]|nr:tetratricopeptide repeat protein [Treponema sp.]
MKKRQGKARFQCALLAALLLFLSGYASAQPPGGSNARLAAGIELFSQGRWDAAVLELRRLQAEAPSGELRAEALFWISMAQLFSGEHEQALRDMDALEAADPASRRIAQLPYHRGRALFKLGRYDQAIVFLARYADSILPGADGVFAPADSGRLAAALFWTAECLFAMGQIDRASDLFRRIAETFPASRKLEAANSRLAQISQSRAEAELLSLLRWTHEESLRNMEEFRRREMAHNQAMILYQRRIADMLGEESRLADLARENDQFRRQLETAEDRIYYLERALR